MPEAKLAPQAVHNDVLTEAVKQRAANSVAQRVAATTATNADAIKANPVFQVLTNPNLNPNQKKRELAAFMAATDNKEANRAAIKAWQECEEHMQNRREAVSKEIIALTDTETVSELQAVYKEMQQELINFNGEIEPLVELMDAIYRLRTSNKAGDAFIEIVRDRKEEERVKGLIDGYNLEVEKIEKDLAELDTTIVEYGQEKGFFGYGGVTKAARIQIELASNEKANKIARLAEIQTKIKETKPVEFESTMGENGKDKDELRRLLDLNSSEWKAKQESLVGSATSFIETSKRRTTSVRDHLGLMDTQIERLSDANGRMIGVYAIMGDALGEAKDASMTMFDEVSKPDENESNISRMEREEKSTIVGAHLKGLNSAVTSTVSTFGDLTGQNIRIGTMKESNAAQLDQARMLSSQGVAGIADRLSVVLQAVGGAALGESTAGAKDILQQMKRSTDNISQKDTIRLAMGIEDTNKDIAAAMEGLMQAGEVLSTSNKITRDGIGNMLSLLDQMNNAARGVQDTIKTRNSIGADANKDREGQFQVVSDTTVAPAAYDL